MVSEDNDGAQDGDGEGSETGKDDEKGDEDGNGDEQSDHSKSSDGTKEFEFINKDWRAKYWPNFNELKCMTSLKCVSKNIFYKNL